MKEHRIQYTKIPIPVLILINKYTFGKVGSRFFLRHLLFEQPRIIKYVTFISIKIKVYLQMHGQCIYPCLTLGFLHMQKGYFMNKLKVE